MNQNILLGKLLAAMDSASLANDDLFAANGHLDILSNLINCNFTCNAMYLAASNGHYSVVEWLYNNQKFSYCVRSAIIEACRNGHTHIAIFLKEKNEPESCLFPQGDIYHIIRNGHLHTLMWINDNYKLNFGTDEMDIAAEYGRLTIIQWLHDEFRARWSISKWLFGTQPGCTSDAIILASKNGHFATANWLFENYKSKCKVDPRILVAKFAINNGHSEYAAELLDDFISQS